MEQIAPVVGPARPRNEPWPAEIAKAVNLVMRAIGKLEKDGKNDYGKGYKYTSIDGFLSAVGPACAEANLIIKPVCIGVQRTTVTVADKDGKPKDKIILDCEYKIRLIHAETGITWTDEEDVRSVAVDWNGPQSYMGAESFVLKAYERTLFQIATGDPDPDASEQHEAEITRSKVKTAKANLETGEQHIPFDFGEGLAPIPIKDLPAMIKKKLSEFKSAADITDWLNTNKAGREQIHIQAPNLYHKIRKDVEAALKALNPSNKGDPDLLSEAAE